MNIGQPVLILALGLGSILALADPPIAPSRTGVVDATCVAVSLVNLREETGCHFVYYIPDVLRPNRPVANRDQVITRFDSVSRFLDPEPPETRSPYAHNLTACIQFYRTDYNIKSLSQCREYERLRYRCEYLRECESASIQDTQPGGWASQGASYGVSRFVGSPITPDYCNSSAAHDLAYATVTQRLTTASYDPKTERWSCATLVSEANPPHRTCALETRRSLF